MEPGLHAGDTVVVNTDDRQPRDGEVFAVNYEGEYLIRRLVRDGGCWWLSADSADQRRFPRRGYAGEECIVIGRVVHKQSEVRRFQI
jgi:phage repressor protein C with HTH and peptisase S24 domain